MKFGFFIIILVLLRCTSAEEGEECSQTEEFKNTLFSMGNSLLDITIPDVDESFFDDYDIDIGMSLTLDFIEEKMHLPTKKDLVDIFGEDRIVYTAGGAAMNTFRAFQWMLNEGIHTSSYVASIGDDECGQILENEARRSGLMVNFYKFSPDEYPTGTCISLVTNNERTLIADLSASRHFPPSFFTESEENQEMMKSAKMYYYSAYFFPVYFEGIIANAEHAKTENKVFSINLSSVLMVKVYSHLILELMKYSTHIFANKNEALELGRIMGWEKECNNDLKCVGLKLSNYLDYERERPKTIIFTQGANPTLVFEQVIYSLAPLQYRDVKTTEFEVKESVNPVDTNGAGDSFCGGFLSQLAKKRSLEQCVRAGHYVSKIIVETQGVEFPDFEPRFEM